jgi:hypothetical protein
MTMVRLGTKHTDMVRVYEAYKTRVCWGLRLAVCQVLPL